LGGRKNVQNSAPFLTTFDFDREYLRNDSRYPKSERNVIDSDSSRVPRKKSGEFWSTNKKVLLARIEPPKWIFWGDYISAPSGCCALKFIHALEIAHALIAHTRSGTGVPQKIFNHENLKIWLKIQRISHCNFGAGGSIPTKHFPYDVPRGRGHYIGITFGRPAP